MNTDIVETCEPLLTYVELVWLLSIVGTGLVVVVIALVRSKPGVDATVTYVLVIFASLFLGPLVFAAALSYLIWYMYWGRKRKR